MTIDKVEDQFFKTEFKMKLPQMEFEEIELTGDVPPELKLPELNEEDENPNHSENFGARGNPTYSAPIPPTKRFSLAATL